MPELPEVETVRRDLAEVLPGRAIKTAEIFDRKLASDPIALCAEITGKIFSEPERRGKYLILPFERFDKQLVIHLRMTGQIIYRETNMVFASGHPAKIAIGLLPDKHTRMRIMLDDGGEVFFNDQRRFGTVALMAPSELSEKLAPFGIEPGTKDWSFDRFARVFTGRKAPIKSLLLNQTLIFGLGNIYADEACHRASLLPMRPAASLSAKEIERLFAACGEVIAEAVELRGTSMRDFVDSHGIEGGFAEKLRVYRRTGHDCPGCGHPIARGKCAGRGTHFCPVCQK